MKLKLIIFLLFIASSAFSMNFSKFFEYVEKADVDKIMRTLEKMKPRKEALPYFRTATDGLVLAMEWRFRQDISVSEARDKAIEEITNSSLSDEDKAQLVQIVEYLSQESDESFLQKSKRLLAKKKQEDEAPPFQMEAVEIFYGALLTQVPWAPISNVGDKMVVDGVRRLQSPKWSEAS